MGLKHETECNIHVIHHRLDMTYLGDNRPAWGTLAYFIYLWHSIRTGSSFAPILPVNFIAVLMMLFMVKLITLTNEAMILITMLYVEHYVVHDGMST